jgi:acyl-CoA thioester hydrolase
MTTLVGTEHIDGLGHVNNTQYIRWCEQAAWAHSASLGMGLDVYTTLDRAMAVVRAEFDYIQAAYKGDALVVGTWLTFMDNRLNMERVFEVRNASTGALLCQGLWRFACIRLSTGKPCRMPQAFIEAYAPAIVQGA